VVRTAGKAWGLSGVGVRIGAPGERRGSKPQAVATGAEPVANGC
jgi:hypothetical protein